MFSVGEAFQLSLPLARQNELSSATLVVRDYGSGVHDGDVPNASDPRHEVSVPLFPVYTRECRLGEAGNPGPGFTSEALLTVGVSNPGGLRGKESLLLEQQTGIWTMAETQLSSTTMVTSAGILRSEGASQNRAVRPLFSAPAPLRSNSTWAGSWCGVATVADWPSTTLNLPWPQDHWNSARVLVSRHWVGQVPVVIGGFYGYSQGPTWPQSRRLNDSLLETMTQEIVIGMQGIRIIQGDFNYNPGELTQQQLWARYGWCNAQTLAAETLNHEITMTCKHTTERDQIWLSPEAAQLLRGIQVVDLFADHRLVKVQLMIPDTIPVMNTWPRPSKMPWQDIDTEDWEPQCPVTFSPDEDVTKFFGEWSQAYERACDHRYRSTHGKPLPSSTKGRAQRLEPLQQQPHTPGLRPSRHGEITVQHSLTGMATKLWFKQARRFQSLRHSVQAGKQTPSAICYRAELWTSILRAKGFVPDFHIWWQNKETLIDGSPIVLPQGPPAEGDMVNLLYEEYMAHFRRFETWHIGQRTKCLKTKYEGSLKALFYDLRSASRHGVDLVWKEHCYTVLAVDDATGCLHLDAPICTDFDFVWLLHDSQVRITGIDGEFCTISGPVRIVPGDELVQRVFVHETQDLMRLFNEYWQPRWNLMQAISESDWQRLVAFVTAYMPRHRFVVEDLDQANWQRTLATCKPHAARGPDGFDRDDLVHVPTAFQTQFLNMMTAIEDTDTSWPAQLQMAMVIGLAKHDHSHDVGHYRPINLFSLLYRTWARLRTKEMIRQFAEHIPHEALGFLPGRETAEVWLHLQAHIELMMQLQQTYCGLSTDLQKAFNCIGRRQVLHIAQHLGIPMKLLRPWFKFLGSFRRRFEIRNQVGDELTSSSGFPEGCPLSIVAMLCVNWAYHIYMRALCPQVTAYSFVDNLSLASLDPEHIVSAYFALRCLCDLFGLTTDDSKTYVWATTPKARKLLQHLGFPCLQDASELGGVMTYGFSVRNRALRQKGASLDGKWDKLKRSLAPQLQKYAILPKIFWPKALHGAGNCLSSDGYVHDLRKSAVKALRANGAGSNPLLRLSLSDDPCNDPGFYQLSTVLRTFRRLLGKSPDLQPMWKLRLDGFTGKMLPGPFSRLIQCLDMIGWSMQGPPWLLDHEQRSLNLLTIDDHTLFTCLLDAWYQYVAASIHRKTMQDLKGLDGYLTLLDTKKLPALQRALVSALHSGAFVSDAEHSKFDFEKTGMCSLCGCEDDRAHWLVCPRFCHHRTTVGNWPPDVGELPDCTLHHLLVPRLEEAVLFRAALWNLEDHSFKFCVNAPPKCMNHLFLDGSCTRPRHEPLRLAAWAVLNATTGMAIALGPLVGLAQTIGRAELTALLTALRWASFHQVDCCLWSDSLSTVRKVNLIMRLGQVPFPTKNYDLWLEVSDLLQQCVNLCIWVRWVPSHIPLIHAEDPFEEWAIFWNGMVDQLAAEANRARDADFWMVFQRYELTLDFWAIRVRALRHFYILVAEDKAGTTAQTSTLAPIVDAQHQDDEFPAPHSSVEDSLPINWQAQCSQAQRVPSEFLVALLNWWCDVEILGDTVQVLSEIEFVFALILTPTFQFPFQLGGLGAALEDGTVCTSEHSADLSTVGF
eukprot:Skav223965  [mRNA]  locus=scaffold3540:263869:268707:+ [translate_table: standard]